VASVSDALESEVAAIRALSLGAVDGQRIPRQRALIDHHFARMLKLLRPRIRHFVRVYGLMDHADDAEQACAIGVLRAVEAFEPTRARFTTLVNWQLRGELQSLRHRVRLDSRESARSVGARTISLEELAEAGGMSPRHFADGGAEARVESLAADVMARRLCGTLLDAHFAERRQKSRADERPIIEALLLGDDDDMPDVSLTAEQRRQIARRTFRALSARVQGDEGVFGAGIPAPN